MTTAGSLLRRLRRSALRHFCPTDTAGISHVPEVRGPGSGPRLLRSQSQILGQTPPSCWYPRDSSIVRGHRVQAGMRSRDWPVAVATVRGHFLVPERFTPAWHIDAAAQSRIRVTASRKIDPTASQQRDEMHLRSDRHRWEISAFSRFTCRHARVPRLRVRFPAQLGQVEKECIF